MILSRFFWFVEMKLYPQFDFFSDFLVYWESGFDRR